ncbi:MAG: DNA-directed RNA polymerase subunit omega [Kiritimatiellae bacterium]|nr:DNA-directed RNA polymerase subunit omega [Kiritimatiellia bacterium]
MNIEYLEDAKKKIPNVPILINMVARRVRQINRGFRPYVKPQHSSESPMDLALREIREDKLTAEISFTPAQDRIPDAQ